ncbi:hypothetical protein BDF22DRAFT_743789 [Syncephalis plumigaleata]|nr:hypothetical protein BDF22DRAFT_743789 [Syncephalis plumigaleata]
MASNDTSDVDEWPAGLILVENFVSPEEEEALVAIIDKQSWSGHGIGPNPEMRRRTHIMDTSLAIRNVTRQLDTPMPELFTTVLERIVDDPRQLWKAECSHKGEECDKQRHQCRLFHGTALPPDSVIVNEYERGQGIMPHTDAPSAFGPVVASLSLLSDCLFTFYSTDESNATFSIKLPRRSLLIMRGYVRYQLRHGISKDPVEYHHEEVIERSRRVSLTIRRIGGYGHASVS